MILLIPYTQFTLKSHLPTPEIGRRLAIRTIPCKFSKGLPKDPAIFCGVVENNGKFHLTRLNRFGSRDRYRFIIMVGQIYNDIGTGRIEVKMRGGFFDMILTAFIIFISGFMFVGFLSNIFSRTGISGNDILSFVSAFGFIAIFHGFSMIPFNRDANKTRRYLEEILQAEVDNFEFSKTG
jgi:hypothetical protein